MRAALCRAFGGIDDLAIEELPDPVPAAGEVLVGIHYAALNFFDLLIIAGKYQVKPQLPFSPAGEFSGRVLAIGANVTGFALGDRVCGYSGYGAARDKICVKAEMLSHLPSSISDETAAGLSITYGTTLHALKQRAHLQPGESLAILGASGGVGLAAIELGRLMGATIIACASSQEKLDFAKKVGADVLIDYSREDWREGLKSATQGRGVDVIYDAVGGAYTEPALRSIAWKGRLLVVGFAAGDIPKIPLNLALLKGCSLVGVFWGEFIKREPHVQRENMQQLLSWAAEGKLSTHVHAIYPLAEIGQAMNELASRKAQGKVLLKL
jgi:NADPH2:quinone reductase